MENKGQTDARAQFYLQDRHTHLYLEQDGFRYLFLHTQQIDAAMQHPQAFWEMAKAKTIRAHALKTTFVGASIPRFSTRNTSSAQYHFFMGNEPTLWAVGCKSHQQVIYEDVYKGIDLLVYTTPSGTVKYDWSVKPLANPKQIKVKYDGHDDVKLMDDGSLLVRTATGELKEMPPIAYQWIGGDKRFVPCEYIWDATTGELSFSIKEYDSLYQLIIDPELIFSTYSGSLVDNFGSTATYGADGSFYSGGITTGPFSGYPVTPGAFDATYNGGVGSWPQFGFSCDITISKYSNDGSELLYATYLGGNRNDYIHSMVVNTQNELVVLGTTLSANYPVTANAVGLTKNDSFDIVITKFNASGTALIGSTYLGGNGIDGINALDTLCMNYMDQMRGEIQYAANGDVLVASVTSSTNFPTTAGAYQTTYAGNQDGCVVRLNPNLSQLVFSTYVGSAEEETLNALEVATNGELYIAGATKFNNFPILHPAADSVYNGGISDGWIAKMTPNGSNLSAFTYTGTDAYDQVFSIRCDRDGNVYALAQTFGVIPVTPGKYGNDTGNIYIASFTPSLDSLRWVSTMGNGVNKNLLSPSAFMVDICGALYTSVWAGSTNIAPLYGTGGVLIGASSSTASLPITAEAIQPITDGQDFYLFVLAPEADSLSYATFLGEPFESDHVDGGTSRFNKNGVIYQSICASCNAGPFGNFPTTPTSAFPNNSSPRCSNVSLKIDFRVSNLVSADFIITPQRRCSDSLITFTNNSFNSNEYRWFVDGVLVDTTTNLQRIFNTPGFYDVKLVAIDSSRCNLADSVTKRVRIGVSNRAAFTFQRDTCSDSVFFFNQSVVSTGDTLPVFWNFGDGNTSTLQNPVKSFAFSDFYLITMVVLDTLGCSDTAFQLIPYNKQQHILSIQLPPLDSIGCEPYSLFIANTGNGGKQYRWFLNDTLIATTRNLDTFVMAGVYQLKYVVFDSATCALADTFVKDFVVVPELTPNFTWQRDSCSFTIIATNTTAPFVGDSAAFMWLMPTGDTLYSRDVSYTFPQAGTYQVTIVVNRGLWCERRRIVTITLDDNNRILESQFVLSKQPVCMGDSILFTNTSTNGIRWQWWLNNQLQDSSKDWAYRFDSAGTYTLQLIALDTVTCFPSDTFSQTWVVHPFTPAVFSWFRDTCAPQINFMNETDTSNGQQWIWRLGDGTERSDYSFNYSYANDGSYQVWLVTNPISACADSVSAIIDFDADAHLLQADFVLNDSASCAPYNLIATNNSLNGKQIQWFLNGELIGTGNNIDTTLQQHQVYELKLLVIDSATCSQVDSVVKSIRLFQQAVAGFELLRDSCSLDVTFKNTSEGIDSTTQFYWSFGNGDTSDVFEPQYTYAQTGNYEIMLIVNRGSPCADTILQTHFIDGDTATQVRIANVFTPNNDGFNDCFVVEGVNDKCDEYEIWIRNRWGNLFFYSNNAAECWNGKNTEGVNAAAGVYYYLVNIRKRSGKLYQTYGTVTLIRED